MEIVCYIIHRSLFGECLFHVPILPLLALIVPTCYPLQKIFTCLTLNMSSRFSREYNISCQTFDDTWIKSHWRWTGKWTCLIGQWTWHHHCQKTAALWQYSRIFQKKKSSVTQTNACIFTCRRCYILWQRCNLRSFNN